MQGAPARYGGHGWWMVAGAWTAAATAFAAVLRVQVGVPFLPALLGSFADYYTLGALMVGVWWLNERLALLRGAAFLAAHLALGLAVILLWKGIDAGFLRLVLGPHFWRRVYSGNWGFQLLAAMTTYGTALGIVLVTQAARREREQERRAAAAELLAGKAEMQTLKGQLQPHFLMNALNSVLALLEEEPERAREVLFRLADVLQSVFERLDAEAVPLAEEMEFVDSYLQIEQVRLGERLRYELSSPEELGAVLVPPFLLQPLVENAVKHGIAPFTRAGALEVSARRQDGHLLLEVSDSGPGLDPGAPPGQGRGLELTRRRLQALYGGQGELAYARAGAWFTVRIDLPLTRHADGRLEAAPR